MKETSIEHSDVVDIRQDSASDLNAINVRWVVQRRERDKVADHVQDLIGDDLWLAEQNTAVHHTVADRRDFDVAGAAAVLVHQLKRKIQPDGVVRDRRLLGVLVPNVLQGDAALRFANLLHQTRHKRRIGGMAGGIHQLEFDRA